MKVFFISDLHLNENYLNSYDLFTKFCNNLPPDTHSVYILGDLFEYWIDDDFKTDFLINVKKKIHQLSKKCKVYFIAGNRDFLIGKKFAQETGIIMLPNIFTLNLFGHKTILLHGDLLHGTDQIYYYFMKIIRHPITIFIANILPIKFKLFAAKFLRTLSKKKHLNYKNKNKNHVVNHHTIHKLDDYNYINLNIINKLITKYNAELLIHGHTHIPNIYKHNTFTRVVLSDWHHQATILEFTSSGYQLINITN